MAYIKNIFKILLCILIFSKYSQAQVEDISFTLSPKGEYVWWDNKAGIEDGLMYGGNLGFGFGEYLEIRALYIQSNDLKRDFSQFGLPTGYESIVDADSKLNISKWGGELRANIGTGGLYPFITLGTGVQKIKTDFGTETENIYASGGLGIRLKLADRISLTLEGKAIVLNMNSGVTLLSETEKNILGLSNDFFENERLYNFSALASLQFYLGGRVPGQLTDLDRAYVDKFKGGLKGLKFVLEPASSYIEFDDELAFIDTYFLGGYLGLDFNDYIGIHGFYFQGVQNEKIIDNFDDIAMYGLEIRANLNSGNGVIPYLIFGGGYLNAYNNSYLGIDGQIVESSEFAKGGIGLKIPLSKYFSINASASSFLTSGSNFEDVSNTKSIQNSWNYSLGLNLHLAGHTKAPNKIYQSNLQNEVAQRENELTEIYQKQMEQQKIENQKRINNLKDTYKQKLDSLNYELKVAKKNNDIEKAIKILEESKQIQENLKQVEDVEKKNQSSNPKSLDSKNETATTKETENVDHTNKSSDAQKTSVDLKNNQENRERISTEEYENLIIILLEKIKNNDLGSLQKQENLETKYIAYKKALERQEDKIESLKKEIFDNDEPKNDDVKLKQLEKENFKKQDLENQMGKSKEEEKASEIAKLEKQIQSNARQVDKILDKLNTIESRKNSDRYEIINNIKQDKGKQPQAKAQKEVYINDLNQNPEKLKELLEDTNVKANKTYKRDYFNSYDFVDKEEPVIFKDSTLVYKGSSAIAGFNVGGQSTFNLGVRAHFGIKSTDFEIMPEITTSISNPISFGFAINAIHPYKLNLPYNISPYAGIGTGYLYNDEYSSLTGNILLGFYINGLGGRFYFDYTNRNLFDFNQFAMGYRFNF